MQRLSLIFALTKNRVIGNGGTLAWDLPDELAYFHRTTAGKPVIMGRKTYQSVNRPMPGRLNVVLSRRGFSAEGVTVVADLDAALAVVAEDPADEVFVTGGTDPFRAALPRADRLYATFIDAELSGDAFFPDCDFNAWRPIWRHRHPADERHPYSYESQVLVRRSADQPVEED